MMFQVLLILLFASPAIAYDQHSTHPSLTYEMAQYFNIKNNKPEYNLTSQETKWLMRGAEDEDEPARWINHFYDPVHGVGWSGKHFGSLSQAEGYKTGADIAPRESLPSYQWVTNQDYQSAYGSEYGNQTWQKAIKLFADGNKQAAFVALGHTLHIVEDATVPDHVRDDSHPGIEGDPGSPFEGFSKDETDKGELQVAENLKNDLLQLDSIGLAIQNLSRYTNANFFSEDTISNIEFNEPYNSSEIIIIKIGDNIAKYKVKDGVYLARIISQDTLTGSFVYTTRDKNFVLPSYRDHLFPKAVLTGASVIKLFFEEVEKYKKNPELMEPVVANQYTPFLVALAQAPKRNVIKVCGYLDSSCTDIANVAYETKIGAQNFFQTLASTISGAYDAATIKLGLASPPANTQSNGELASEPVAQNPPQPALVVPTVVIANPQPTIANPPLPRPSGELPKTSKPIVVVENILPTTVLDVPVSVIVIPAIIKPVLNYVLAFGYNPPAPAPSENVAADPIVDDVASTSTDLIVSSTPSVLEESTTSTEPTATSTDSVTTTIETSTTTPEISTSTISVTSTTDTATTTTSTPVVEPVPEVVINEVAWAGTASTRSNDEWFELYNNTDQDIDLTGWRVLVSGAPINLVTSTMRRKIISAHGYYLLERSEDTVIRDIAADAIYPYTIPTGFNNGGEKLELFKPNGDKVDEVDASGDWFAGDNVKYRSMERIDAAKNGNDRANWQSNLSNRPTGQNASNAPVYGSPRQSNFGFIMLNSSQEETIKTLDIKNSPYVIWSYQVPAGKTLNIDQGVDIFLLTYGSLTIDGSLNALGTQDKPINFVPYPTSTSWANLKFNNSTSTLNFVNIRRGDTVTRLWQNLDGMILAKNSNLIINNALIWDSEANAIGGTDSIYNISNTTIGASVKNNKTYGINIRGGVLSLDNVVFNNLYVGVEGGSPASTVLQKKNMPNSNFINVDYPFEPSSWWNSASSTTL